MTELHSDVPQTAIDSAIEHSTGPLQEYQERPGIGGENRRLVGERILQVTSIVQDNPERVAADIGRSPDHRTEYDPQRAHLAALAIDKNMTRLAADKQRSEAGKRMMPWRKTKRERDLIGSKLGEDLANEVYDNDPIEAGPNAVESRRLQAVRAGNGTYRYIKSAKRPRL
jgi:hypothetical protein